jgi:hypothetical protein
MLQALYGIVEGLSPKTPSFLKYTFSGGYAKNPMVRVLWNWYVLSWVPQPHEQGRWL